MDQLSKGILQFLQMKIWGKAGERWEVILAKTLKNKGKYIAYERESCISGWNVIQEAVK